MPWTRVVKIKERVRNASSKMEMEGCIYHFSDSNMGPNSEAFILREGPSSPFRPHKGFVLKKVKDERFTFRSIAQHCCSA